MATLTETLNQIVVDGGLFHAIVQGASNETVSTEGGVVPTVANVIGSLSSVVSDIADLQIRCSPLSVRVHVQTFAELVSAKDSSAVVVIDAPLVMTANLTLTCRWSVNPGCTIMTTGYTLSSDYAPQAGLYQIFTGTGTVSFGSKASLAYPQWFGAAADGVTELSAPLQKAINALTAGAVVLPYSSLGYRLTASINAPVVPKSNVMIRGDLFQPKVKLVSASNSAIALIFDANTDQIARVNLGFKNLHFISTNEQTRITQEGRPGLGSNVHAIDVDNCDGLVIEDVRMDNMEFAIKLGIAGVSNVRIDNWKTTGTYTPIFARTTSRVTGRDWDLDCPITGNKYDHHIYIVDSSDWNVINVRLRNGTGNASITTASQGGGGVKNLNFSEIELDSANGFILSSGNGVHFRNIFGTLYNVDNSSGQAPVLLLELGFAGSGIIENITVEDFYLDGDYSVLYKGAPTGTETFRDVKLINGIMRGTGVEALWPERTTRLTVDNVICNNLTDRAFVCGIADTAVTSSILRNCDFTWAAKPLNDPVDMRTSVGVASLLIQACGFTNLGTVNPRIVYKTVSSDKILIRECTYSGFTADVDTYSHGSIGLNNQAF